MKVDLHCHTNISDCSFSFEEIVQFALKEKVSHLAITNHDTTKGLEEMTVLGKEKGIEIIPGIEISAYDFKRNRRIHVLGYLIEPGHSSIQDLCEPLLTERHQASYLMVQHLIEAGYSISWEQVEQNAAGGTGVYKQHIMHALIDNGYTDSIYGDLYKKLFSRGQNGEAPGIAFVPVKYVDARSAIQVILQAGGVPVLAHPGQYKSFEAVPELVEAGLQGIEVWHPLHTRMDVERAKQFAAEYDLITTGGTDFHGFYGENEVVLGSEDPGKKAIEGLKKRKEVLSFQTLVEKGRM
ncbi:PHP domain-containing protein [Neobacillus bataviensis LMG 21833]|uniref:PHP domain-containing protein n=1 Tax=Neobacillus bataviensis LMG 21833 TaxID=1117379 RepID=K6DC86_9BACI|nr:PHP domain-containing protein [Neobacillus bataviensis]EKN65914.1 PHP domain-containing protein [Neobacillus bataviensis LMG 21833]